MARRMKDSGVAWIGKVPAEWDIERIDSLYGLRNTKCSDKEYPALSVTMKGIVPQLEDVAKTDDGDNRKLVKCGDFVINSRSDRRGACGISQYDGSVSLINIVLRPLSGMNNGYYSWLFRSFAFADEFYANGHGIVDDLWTTRWQDMKRIKVPYPLLAEQKRIAKFLDEKCGKIDELSEKVKAQIEKLEAYKKSIITEAVTKGVQGKRKMKDSGVAWIGQVPVEWEVKRLKYVATSLRRGNGITKEEVYEDGDTPCVRYGEIYTKYDMGFVECRSRTKQEVIASPQYFSHGDILFACTGELIEDIGKSIVYCGSEKCLAGGDITIATHNQNALYLNYCLNSGVVNCQKSSGKAKLKVVHISVRELGNLYLTLPPLAEQKKIADWLDRKCGKVDEIIRQRKAQLEKLAEYKKSLIYEYVTGKKEVAA